MKVREFNELIEKIKDTFLLNKRNADINSRVFETKSFEDVEILIDGQKKFNLNYTPIAGFLASEGEDLQIDIDTNNFKKLEKYEQLKGEVKDFVKAISSIGGENEY